MTIRPTSRVFRAAIGLVLYGCAVDAEPATGETSLVISADIELCPIVTEVSIVPLEVLIGGQIQVTAAANMEGAQFLWLAASGHFEDPTATTTHYVCESGGEQALTLVISEGVSCQTPVGLRVMCSFSPSCGDGVLDPAEECDDGNTTPGDGCSSRCLARADEAPL